MSESQNMRRLISTLESISVRNRASFILLSKSLFLSNALTGADEDKVEIDRLRDEIRSLKDDVRESKCAMIQRDSRMHQRE